MKRRTAQLWHLAITLSLVACLCGCANQASHPFIQHQPTRTQPTSAPPMENIWAARRLALADALNWVRTGPNRLDLQDADLPDLKITVAGPQEAAANDVDLLVPDDRGRGPALMRIGLRAPDASHPGYWLDNIGGGDDDDSTGQAPSNQRVIDTIDVIYINVWGRPGDYRLKILRSAAA